MSNNGAPESWEMQADSGSGDQSSPQDPNDLSAKFSTLNVNAMEFVPSFCLPSQGNDVVASIKTLETTCAEHSSSELLNGKSLLAIFL